MVMSRFIILSSLVINAVVAVHDSLNLIVQPKRRECFFEDFADASSSRTVEAFVQSGGNMDIYLQAGINMLKSPCDFADLFTFLPSI